ncbi:hypothetical protein DM860_005452 [Cuscuta australis]|uniref:AP complex subunit sigma n=1 Tax=Cuscuta australis TaxID=267555 RepID=A0A328E110_9ASTE|nr:hypothetical protein DM860_005452 [Cuscuta australis]
MGIRFILMVNKQGQTRLAQYYEYLTLEERRALEGEIVRKCLTRNEQQAHALLRPFIFLLNFADFSDLRTVESRSLIGYRGEECVKVVGSGLSARLANFGGTERCSFVEHRNYKVVYRRYASLFFLVGVDNEENELAILEFIHLLVETMDRHFGNVCELDIMFHLEKTHFMLEEMVMNGCIVETSKSNILTPIQLMEKAS